jgi:hypothetical protein
MYVPSTAADCCDDAEAVAAFDATFPKKEKKWMPSQEEFYIYSHSSVVRKYQKTAQLKQENTLSFIFLYAKIKLRQDWP